MSGDKSQPQRLLEEVDSTIQHTESEQYPTDPPQLVDAPKFPTIQEQNEYWQAKEKAAEPTPPLVEHPLYDYPPSEGQIKPWDKIKVPPAGTPKPPRKWSLARRRKFNATVAKKKESEKFDDTAPPQEEPVAMIRFCPHCGTSIERFLA